jgi:NifU-like protein involved in Fe-S cluster formation
MDYSAEVLRRFRAPGRASDFPLDAGGVVVAAAEDQSLNVWVRFQVQVSGGRISDVRFNAFGCPHTVAAADWVAERLVGLPVEALCRLDIEEIAGALDVPREKVGKLLRIEDALRHCAEQIETKAKGSD